MMLLALTALTLLWAQDETPSQLLWELDQDDIEAREGVTARLLARGEEVRPAVEQAIRETSNVEVRKRLEGVRIELDARRRRRNFQGGKLLNDLGAKLSITHLRDERLLDVTVELWNLGSAPREIYPLRHWTTLLPGHGTGSSAAEGELEIKQLSGHRPDAAERELG